MSDVVEPPNNEQRPLSDKIMIDITGFILHPDKKNYVAVPMRIMVDKGETDYHTIENINAVLPEGLEQLENGMLQTKQQIKAQEHKNIINPQEFRDGR